jgi:hypothetical protein
MAMVKLTFAKIMLAAITTISSTAMAGPTMNVPIYVGARSANPEHETYGYLVKPGSAQPLAFVGPARNIGTVTGNAERDTIAYRPLLGMEKNGLWSFLLERQ